MRSKVIKILDRYDGYISGQGSWLIEKEEDK